MATVSSLCHLRSPWEKSMKTPKVSAMQRENKKDEKARSNHAEAKISTVDKTCIGEVVSLPHRGCA